MHAASAEESAPSPGMQATDGAVMDDFDMDLDVCDGSTIVSRLRLPVDLAIGSPYERISTRQRWQAPA